MSTYSLPRILLTISEPGWVNPTSAASLSDCVGIGVEALEAGGVIGLPLPPPICAPEKPLTVVSDPPELLLDIASGKFTVLSLLPGAVGAIVLIR